MSGPAELDGLARRAREGDRAALGALVQGVRDRLYGLALRMLWHPHDAEDATQEILIKVITHLGDFRGDSAFTTWAYRIACNHLLTMRKRRAEERAMTFDEFEAALEKGLASEPGPEAAVDQRLLLKEAKIGCMLGMLLCLDREQRLAYILGEILRLPGPEAALILETSPEAFRQRLSRARQSLGAFMSRHCGWANPSARCRCSKQTGPALRQGRIAPGRFIFANHPTRSIGRAAIQDRIETLDELERAAALYRDHPDFAAPDRLTHAIKELVERER